MSLLRPNSSEGAVESLLVGFLFIFIDLNLGTGFDLVPDVVGWVMVAFSLAILRGTLSRTSDPRLGSAAHVLSWIAAGLTGILLLVGLLDAVGVNVGNLVLSAGPLVYALAFSEVVAMLAVAALAAFIERHARRFGASSTTLKLLRAGWIVALAAAGLYTLALLGLFPASPFLLRIVVLAAGIVTGIGVSRCRNESVV